MLPSRLRGLSGRPLIGTGNRRGSHAGRLVLAAGLTSVLACGATGCNDDSATTDATTPTVGSASTPGEAGTSAPESESSEDGGFETIVGSGKLTDYPLQAGQVLVATCDAEGTVTGLVEEAISGRGFFWTRKAGEPGDPLYYPVRTAGYTVYSDDDRVTVSGSPDTTDVLGFEVELNGPTLAESAEIAAMADELEPIGADGVIPSETEEVLDRLAYEYRFIDADNHAGIEGDWSTMGGAIASGTLQQRDYGQTTPSQGEVDAQVTFTNCTAAE